MAFVLVADCSRDLDIVVLMDGSGGTGAKRNRLRWDEMKEFVVAFSKGFDEHGRIGVIAYGEDSEIICPLQKAYKPEVKHFIVQGAKSLL